MDLQCARCGAPLSMPEDFGVWLVHCQYCGFEHELPDRAARQAFAERRQQEAARAAQAQGQAQATALASQRAARRTWLLAAVFTLGPLLLIGGVVWWIIANVTLTNDGAGANAVAAPTPPEPAAMTALEGKAEATGCPRVIDAAEFQNGEYSGTFKLVKSECVRFLALSTPAAPLTLLVTDAAGVITTRSAPSGTLDATYCPRANAEHQVKLRGAPQFWIEALACPRTFGSDPDTTGKAKVGAKLKQLMAHGCYQISFANSTFSDERKFTTTMDPGTCFDLIAATGITDNELKATLSSPFGENIAPLPRPATEIEIPYCAPSAGPYVSELSAAVDGPFSVAIAICSRNALPKVLPTPQK